MLKSILFKVTGVLALLGSSLQLFAQDPQFSQFYAAPLYLNPAFAGSTLQARAGLNYRNQWPAVEASFVTYSAYFDYFFEDYNSGVGMLINQDTEGLAGLNSTSVSIQYSYQVFLTEYLAFRPALQAGFFYRNLNFSRLTFGDQFDPLTGEFINPNTAEQFNTGFSKAFVDISSGGLLYTKNAWLGAAWHHMNTPQQSLLDEDDRLPSKLSVHGGFKFILEPAGGGYEVPRQRSITATFQYKHQGPFDQIDLGTYFTSEPMVLGLWYRGIPYKQVNGYANNESIVLLVGFIKRGADDELNIGYSYDYTISGLGASSGGAHEFSLSYSWSMRDPRKPLKSSMYLPCPHF